MRTATGASPRATRAPAAAANAASTQHRSGGEDLGANWKSALCVTSLYDSYVQLQQENDALKLQVQEVQLQKNELLAARQNNNKKQRRLLPVSPRKGGEQPEHDGDRDDNEYDEDDEDTARYAQLQREIQLLRAEKEQMELVHTQDRKQSEAQLQEYKTQYNELAEKYQVRYALDPNGAKRVALAVQTLQEALEKVVHEKEELGLRYNKLQQLYNRLQQEQSQCLESLQVQVQQLELKRNESAKKTVVGVLHKWYSGQLAFAWQQWTARTVDEKRKEIEKHERDAIQSQVKAKEKTQRSQRASKFLLKCLQNSTQRMFVVWKHVVQQKRDACIQISAFQRQSALSTAEMCFSRWKRDTQRQSSHRLGLKRLNRVLRLHKARVAWKKWTVEVFVNQRIFDLQQQHKTLSEQLLVLKTELPATKSQLTAAKQDNEQLAARYNDERLRLEIKVHEKHSIETELLKRFSSFFTKQNSRQLLQSVVREWKARVTNQNAVHKRIKWAHDSLQTVKLRKSVIRWHVTIRDQRRYVQVVSQFLTRMRHVGALQALNAWKTYVSGKKEREALVRKVVHRMTHKQIVSCFERWYKFKTQRREMRMALEVVSTRMARVKLSSGFTTWKQLSSALAAAEALSRQQELQRDWELRLEQAKMDTILVRRYLLHWRLKVHKLKASKKLALRTLSRWRNGLLARVFADWQCFRFEQQRQRELISRWLRRSTVAALQSAWLKWHKQLILKSQQELLARVREQHAHDITLLENEIAQLHCAHQNLVASRAETTQNLQLQLENAQREAYIEVQRQERFANALMKIASQKERLELTLQWFRQWRSQVTTIKINRQRVLGFVHNGETQRLSTVFHRWNQLRRQRVLLTKAVKRLRSFMDQYRAIQSFRAWQERMQSTRSVRHFQLSFQQRATQRLCREVLRQWHKAARAHFLIRRTSERIWLFSVHLRVKDLFFKWKAISRHEHFMESKSKKKELLQSIHSRVFSRWTSCSLKVVFDAWTRAVKRAQRGKRAENKLVFMRKMHLLSSSFQQIRYHVALKRKQCRWMRKWCEKHAVKAQLRVFTLWKVTHVRLQRHEIDTLRSIRDQLDAELLKSKDEAAFLTQASLENEAKLEQALKLVAGSESVIQRQCSVTLLQKHFDSWKAYLRQSQTQVRMTERLASGVSKQRLFATFKAWKRTWSAKQSKRMIAEAWSDRRAQALLAKAFYAWSQRVKNLLRLRRKLKAITRKRETRRKRDTLRGWCSQARLRAALSVSVPRLNEIARKVQLHNGIATWRLMITAKKRRESMELEKQRRIVEFITGRSGWNVERVFRSWRAFAAAKRVKYAQLKQCVFKEWTLRTKRLRSQRRLLWAMHRHFTVYYLRVAVARWRNQIHASMLAALQRSNAAQAQQIERVNHELAAKGALVQQAQATAAACDERVARLEGLLSSSSTGAAQLQRQHVRDVALLRLALQKLVSRQVLVAFTRWKAQNKVICDQGDALLRLEHTLRRKQRTLAFAAWKSKIYRASRLKIIQQRVTKSCLQTVVNTWKSYCKRQLRIKVLLVRLCVTAAVQKEQSTLTVCGAFRLLQKHAVMIQTARDLALLKDKVDRDARSTRTSRKQLLLAKWSWRAYTARLQDLHRFFSQCRGVASTKQRQQHNRVLQELTAKLEKVNQEIQLAHQERSNASELEINERAVINSSLSGLRALFRQLAQVSSTRELFGKVASTFPQILHGSAGTSVSTEIYSVA